MLFLTALLVVLFVSSVQVRYTGSDPRGSLFVSKAIVEHGTIRLDAYAPAVQDLAMTKWRHGHVYYLFPLGTPVSAVPFVYVFMKSGFDLTNGPNEARLQIVIAACVAVATVFSLYEIARRFLGARVALAMAVLFWLSTPLVSTNATALWSHDFAVLYSLIVIHLMLRWGAERERAWWRSAVITVALFMAYLCRPTLALLGIVSVISMAFLNRRMAMWMGFFGAALAAVFVLFSFREFGLALPPYYLARRLKGPTLGGGSYRDALIGNLISPSRGLLVFCPFLIVAGLHVRALCSRLKENVLVIMVGVVWPMAHWITVSAYPHWWGGWSFGPRLMADVLPGLFLLLCASISSARWKSVMVACAVPLFAVSVWINAWQGCFNSYTDEWNANPVVDLFPEYLFDWRYPQFLHNAERHRDRIRRHVEAHAESLSAGMAFRHDSPNLGFLDWHEAEETTRRSAGTHPAILFRLGGEERPSGAIALDFELSSRQRLMVVVNGHVVWEGVYDGAGRHGIDFKLEGIGVPGINEIDFVMPDGGARGAGEDRRGAVAFKSIERRAP